MGPLCAIQCPFEKSCSDMMFPWWFPARILKEFLYHPTHSSFPDPTAEDLPSHCKDLKPLDSGRYAQVVLKWGSILLQPRKQRTLMIRWQFLGLRTALCQQKPQFLTQQRPLSWKGAEWTSPAHLRAGTWMEGMARCLVSVMESRKLFFLFNYLVMW